MPLNAGAGIRPIKSPRWRTAARAFSSCQAFTTVAYHYTNLAVSQNLDLHLATLEIRGTPAGTFERSPGIRDSPDARCRSASDVHASAGADRARWEMPLRLHPRRSNH